MKKRSLLKRIAAIAMSAAMVLGMATAAQADTGIDTAREVSLTINKTDGKENPIAGVQFAYQKIGNIGEVSIETETATAKSVLGYQITNDTIKDILVKKGLEELKTDSGYYDASEIQRVLKEVVDEDKAGKTTIEDQATVNMPLTDSEGKTTVPTQDGDRLEQGLYLVVEKEAPAGVTAFCDPFIVSLPLYNADGEWVYDVVASPKNTVEGQPVVDKKVVNDDGKEITDPSTLVGEIVNFEVTATVPSGVGTLSKFDIVDTMSKGLTFKDGSVVVKGYRDGNDTNGKIITDLFNSTPTSGDEGVTNILISCKDADTNLKNVYKKVVVTYSATVNKDALTIDNVNNKVGLDYDNTPGIDTSTDTVKVPVYGYKLTKVAGDNKTGLVGAEFKLYSDKDCREPVQMYDATGKEIESVASQKDGTVVFYVKGIDTAATYYLKEMKAPDGYTLLKDPIEIKISESTKLVSQINIVNTKGFDLPQTGGTGTIIFTVGGIAIMLGAAFLLIRANKKSKAN